MKNEKGRTRKVLATTMVLGLFAGLATIASFAAFSSTTSNGSNDFDAGTVHLTDNDGGFFMYDLTNQEPLASVTKCIKVTYTGTLDSAVELYASAPGALGDYLDLKIEEGTSDTSTFPNCGTFTPTAELYNAEFDEFAAAHSSSANGMPTVDDDGGDWQVGDTQVYRFTVTLQDDNGANGGATAMGTNDHSFTWYAENI